MPAMNKDLLHQGYNFTIACFDNGIDATPVSTWLTEQARLGMAPIVGTETGTHTGLPLNGLPTFDNAVLAAVRSSPNGVDMNDLRAILAQYGKPPAAIGAALGRLQKKQLISKKGNLWTAGKVTSIDTRRQRKRGAARAANKGAGSTTGTGNAGAGEAQPAAAAAG
jgi:hypothetical protein